MKEEPPAKPRRLRLGKLHWWILALFLAVCGYQAWRINDYQAAVREAEAAGFSWESTDTFDLIRKDWQAALRKETWGKHESLLHIGEVPDPGRYRELIHRLRPTELRVGGYKDLDDLKGLTSLRKLCLYESPRLQNIDALKGLADLQELNIVHCHALQNLDGLRGLTSLQALTLVDCHVLRKMDALRGLIGLKHLHFLQCYSLQNVDGLKGLTGLRVLELWDCPKIPPAALRELRLALPNTDITFPDGRSIPPE